MGIQVSAYLTGEYEATNPARAGDEDHTESSDCKHNKGRSEA